MSSDRTVPADTLAELRRLNADQSNAWPTASWVCLTESGVPAWTVPAEWGGQPGSPLEMLDAYVALAEACLTTAFILTQRNGAVQRLACAPGEDLKSRWLPALARGEVFATVGISHLTTSRQHWQTPTVSARPDRDGFLFTGEVPWVTGAALADVIVTGGTLPDGQQILVALNPRGPGVSIQSPATLLALSGSQTCSVRLDDVPVSLDELIVGPAESVLKLTGSGTGSLTTTALALGLSRRACAGVRAELAGRPHLADVAQGLESHRLALETDLRAAALWDAATAPPETLSSDALRTRANSLVLRSTQCWLGTAKGQGYVAGHPAEQAVREALFFLVWSCPQAVLTTTLRELAMQDSPEVRNN